MDHVEAQAAAMGLIVLYGLLSALVDEIIRRRNKQFPPVGTTMKDYQKHWAAGDLAYWLLECIRDGQEKKWNTCGVMEVQQEPCFTLNPLKLWTGRHRPFYVVAEHETARAILGDPATVKLSSPSAGENADQPSATVNNRNIVTEALNGPRWKHVRKSTAAALGPANLRAALHHTDQVIDVWIENKLKLSIKAGESMHMVTEAKFLMVQIVARAALDHALSTSEGYALVDNLQQCHDEYVSSALPSAEPFQQLDFATWMQQRGTEKGSSKPVTAVFDYCRQRLESYRAKKSKKSDLLLDAIASDADYVTDDERVGDLVAYLVSSVDTTANTLAFCFSELAADPDEQEFLRDTLKDMDEEKQRYCPTIRNILREVLRLHPPQTAAALRVTGPKSIPVAGATCRIPAGSVVLIPLYALHRNGAIYENPDSFVPERWEEATEAMMQSFLPFGAGRRSCQGQTAAQAIMDTVVARLIPRFSFHAAGGDGGAVKCSVWHTPVDLKLSAEKIPQLLDYADDDDNEDASHLNGHHGGKGATVVGGHTGVDPVTCFSLFKSQKWLGQ